MATEIKLNSFIYPAFFKWSVVHFKYFYGPLVENRYIKLIRADSGQ